MWSSSGGCKEEYFVKSTCHCYYIPALGVVNIISATLVMLLPNTLNVVVTVTV